MPWPQALRYLRKVEGQRRERLRELSIAARAAQADEKGWKEWERAMWQD